MQYIDIHSHSNNFNIEVFRIKNLFETQYSEINDNHIGKYSIGIHPWYINFESVENQLINIQKALENPAIWAIGECGIDKVKNTEIIRQSELFEKQIRMAQKVCKPVIIHCVRAYNELLAIRKKFRETVFIIHAFSSNLTIAEQCIKEKMYLSFGSKLLQNSELQNVFKVIDLKNVFFETDNANVDIQEIYKKAAQLKNITENELIIHIKNNFFKCSSNS